jgi:hypothetical protein
MNSDRLNSWLQVFGTFGVILSLIFVGLQIKQSRDIAMADAYQQRTAMAIELWGNQVPTEYLWSAYERMSFSNEPLTESDHMALAFSYTTIAVYLENNHFQYSMGLLNQEHWESTIGTMNFFAQYAEFRDWWRENGGMYRDSFRIVVDEVVSDHDIHN